MKTIEVDLTQPCAAEPTKGHNRWHPDIPPAVEADPGEEVVLQTRDALDGQIHAGTVDADLTSVDLGLVHPLTGPVYVKGAEPGDLLQINVLRIEPAPFGFTSIIPGFGFLRNIYLDPFVAKWEMRDGFATSPQVPGVRVPEACFMGTIGIAPSRALLEEITQRENILLEAGGAVQPPDAHGAVPATEPIASSALRTIPPREIGGNLDIKQLTSGTRLYIPVSAEGALFSAGDAHYAQGDSECCGTAIEMACTLHVNFEVRKGEAQRRGIRMPYFENDGYSNAPEMSAPRRFLAAVGMSVSNGINYSEDATTAAREALLNMINLLMERGYTREQAYVICSVAVDLKVSELVDVPNFVVSAFLPLQIFDA